MQPDSMKHVHVFDEGNPLAARNTRRAVYLTVLMMVFEIAGGYLFNSMALLADGWHMSSHALALGLSVLAYSAARRLAHDTRFAFGTWKIEILGGYTSALALVAVAGSMVYQSVDRLLHPTAIHYDEAILIAVIGLVVNLICAWLLKADHHHEHAHGHGHAHDDGNPHHHDLNLRSAYLHVLADAATSVLAIAALFGGKLWGAEWLDPAVGLAGGILVATWSWGLLRDTGRVLLDAEMDAPVVAGIYKTIAASPVAAEITDLHVWRVGRNKYAAILSLDTPADANPAYFRTLLAAHEELVHMTVEVNHVNASH